MSGSETNGRLNKAGGGGGAGGEIRGTMSDYGSIVANFSTSGKRCGKSM